MKLTRSLCVATVLWLCTVAAVRADNLTPIPAAQSTPVAVSTEPVLTTAPVPVDTAPPVTESTPVSTYLTPVTVARERSTPISSVTQSQPVVSEPTAGPESGQQPVGPSAPNPARTAVTTTSSTVSSAGTPTGNTVSGVPGVSGPSAAAPGASGIGTTLPPDVSSTDLTYVAGSAQAPAQLSCSSKQYPVSGPFLVAPYSGWTEIVSFVDHDLPDYTVDGSIILANGLTARATDGQASDLFPSYWSTSLRQYVNYDGHNGYDLGLSYQPVLAAGDGTVQYAGWNSSDPYAGYGQMILINHHNGYVTLYGHLSRLDVHRGEHVSAGEQIGISGTTGHSSGPHLHFSVFHNCQVTDPYGWTGSGTDPLAPFNGEHSSYLWLPGHDPLLLNPPPAWPTYPAGLRLSLPTARRVLHLGRRQIPPVDRLLLLALPPPNAGSHLTLGAALAHTEAQMTQEAEALTPQLEDLRAQGLIDSYQMIPAVGAVWVHGTATASQLEGLPGVASLSGVQPRDLAAAQAGFSHAILIQIGHQQAPSLWPIGFRSGLHAWRPVTTIVSGQALVGGFALPGEQVVVTLTRGPHIPAVATTTADSTTGGFVAMLHDPAGKAVSVQPGDVVEFESGGRTARVRVLAIDVRVRPHRLTGTAPAGDSLSLISLTPDGRTVSGVATAGASGHYTVHADQSFPAGSLAVAGTANAAGDQEVAASFVPGMEVSEGGNMVRGWTVGHDPHLTVHRAGRVLLSRPVQPASDGIFETQLTSGKGPLILRAGDVLSLGSRWHQRWLTLPSLSATLTAGTRSVRLAGPPHASFALVFRRSGEAGWSGRVTTGSRGTGSAVLPVGPAVPGDGLSASYVAPSGDIVQTSTEIRSFVVHPGASTITGQAQPGAFLTAQALNASGRQVGYGAATADGINGSFRLVMRGPANASVHLAAPVRIILREDGAAVTLSAPPMSIRVGSGSGTVDGLAPAHAKVTLDLIPHSGQIVQRQVRVSASGRILLHVSPSTLGHLTSVALIWQGPDGLSVERTARLRHVTAPTRRRTHHRSGG